MVPPRPKVTLQNTNTKSFLRVDRHNRRKLKCPTSCRGIGRLRHSATWLLTAFGSCHIVPKQNCRVYDRSTCATAAMRPVAIITVFVILKSTAFQWRFRAGAGGAQAPPTRGQAPKFSRRPQIMAWPPNLAVFLTHCGQSIASETKLVNI